MRIAISATGCDLAAGLDPRFGRCRHILVCDGETATATHHENPTPAQAEHGAGIRTAEFVVGLGVHTVISGAVGPKALRVLQAAGVRVFASAATTAQAAFDEFRSGKLREVTA